MPFPSVAGVVARSRARARRLADRLDLETRLGVDVRALAALRIALGLLLLVDLALRARHLTAFYTDDGVLPRATLVSFYPGAGFSLHALSGAAWVQALLFLVAGVAALALLAGYRTTVATAVSLLLLASLHARNPLVLNGGDTLLRRLLFWGVFVPLGGRWSLDGSRWPDGRSTVATVATAALLVQVVLVYTVTGLFKLDSARWLGGTQLQYVLRIDQLTHLLGDALVGQAVLLRGLAWLWLAMVLSSVLLIVLTGRRRVALVALFAAMHVGMLLTIRLGVFPLVSLAALLPFLPAAVWDRVETAGVNRLRRAGTIYRRTVGGTALEKRRSPVRLWTGRRPAVRYPPSGGRWGAGDLTTRRGGSTLVAVLLAGALVWNAMALGVVATPEAVASVRDPGEHAWDMFAGGSRPDGWFVAPARLESGDRVDLYRRSAVDWEPPPDLTTTFPSARWLRYSVALLSTSALREPFAAYLCRRWNRGHADEATSVDVYFMQRTVRLDRPPTVERVHLGRFRCP